MHAFGKRTASLSQVRDTHIYSIYYGTHLNINNKTKAELLVDKAMELKSVGGIYGGNVKPTPFLCLILKMLQIQPEKDIIIEFIRNEDFKYVRALGAFYMRLTASSADVYKWKLIYFFCLFHFRLILITKQSTKLYFNLSYQNFTAWHFCTDHPTVFQLFLRLVPYRTKK